MLRPQPARRTCRRAAFATLLIVWALLLIAPPGPLTPPIAWADDSRAREIMQKVNDRDDGDNQTADMEMILIDKRGNKRKRSIRSFRKDKGKDELSIMFFVSPADVKGTGFLTYDYDEPGKDDDQWLYLPALRKTKRIASSDKSGSFFGSDFNYSDLTERDLEDYDFTLMKDVEVNGATTWQIQALPRSKDVANETGYSKSIMWVRQDIHMVVRSVGWVYKSRRQKYFQIKKLERIDDVWVATEMQMVTKEGRKTIHATILNFDNVKFNQALDPAMFTVRRLEKGI